VYLSSTGLAAFVLDEQVPDAFARATVVKEDLTLVAAANCQY
jgi:hypothetical protein